VRAFLAPATSRGFHFSTTIPVSDIDWNIELRKIAREYDGLPPEPPRPPKRYEFYDRLDIIGVWARLILAATLTLSLFWWPYGRGCGFPLVAFLVSNVMAIVGGGSLTVRAWRDRMVWPFVGSSLVVVIAWTVIAMHALPRVGYAPAGVTTANWSCGSTATSVATFRIGVSRDRIRYP
jgi:hypothetical protein